MKRLNVRMLAYLGLLAAMGVVLAALRPVNLWNLRISFTFIPIAVAAILFGPLPAALLGALIDVLGALLFPSGVFFPGYTLTAFVHGLIYGLFLYQKRRKAAPPTLPEVEGALRRFLRKSDDPLRILAAVLLYLIVCSLGLNTLWISITSGSPYLPLLSTRLVQAAVMTPVQIVVIGLLLPTLRRLRGKLLPKE